MKKLVLILTVFIVVAAFATSQAVTIIVKTAPPAPRIETKTAKPGPKALWIDGHWNWNGKTFVWSKGYWEKTPRGVWTKGYWKNTDYGWAWVSGKWSSKPITKPHKLWAKRNWKKTRHGKIWVKK